MYGTVLYERSKQGGVACSEETPRVFAGPTTRYYADRIRYLPVDDGISVSVGKSVTAPGRGVENRFSKRHFIHYVTHGALFFNGQRISAGQGFYCPSEFLHSIRSDEDTPAVMFWLSAGGTQADRAFAQASPPLVFSSSGEEARLLEHVLYCPRSSFDAEQYFRGLLQMLLSLYGGPKARKTSPTKMLHVQNVLSWLEEHPNASVQEVSDALYLNRKYLARIFREVRGETLQGHLQGQKMQRARAMLADGAPVGAVAEWLGYSDPQAFSHAFRNYYGISPSESFRK